MPRPVLDLVTARRWAMTARLLLGAARERIDALNVFPVADGDTGTNMYLTIDGALDYVRGQFELGAGTDRLKDGMTLISRGMLLAARGNSGIILSQLTRGLAEAVDPDVAHAGPDDVAAAFEAAARTAWDALASPVEGTILSVARAAAEGARAAVERGRPVDGESPLEVADVVTEALDAAREALARTPEQLPVLAASGVVDAGGAGLVLAIEALESVLHDRPPGAGQEVPAWWALALQEAGGRVESRARRAPAGATGSDEAWGQETGGDGTGSDDQCAAASGVHHGGEPDGAVEVMYLLTGSDPERAGRLRTNLAQVGTSVVVAGGPEEFRVHVHLDDPAVAVEAGSLAGSVTKVALTSLHDGHTQPGAQTEDAGSGLAVIACALGDGVCALFASSGAIVVSGGPRRRASAGQLLAAVLASRAPRVVVLPNDPDTAMVALAAADEARMLGVEVDVVPTRSLVEGIAAMAVLDPEGEPDSVVEGMREAAAAVRAGALTRAERAAQTPVGPCAQGQWLGILGRERIVAVDDAVLPVARALVDLLWRDDVEVVTVLLGAAADDDASAAVAQAVQDRTAALGERGEQIEVVTLRGDQPTYPVLLGVE
ncbi:DAK2 domain-containing protein [Ornithinimicrobium pratense]|uniref:DAK2 domain-containing protein n=1 Tax=Ornithinimicrobium pratense TaxID=2593973 RepID=A0A5J6V5D7_9MICO|nr:DAK2 domain-containing protein [Ornithinimicrobium pratense]QFG68995.1 DAK2 domain-containing protein [Ornithinimicrobium pratense]